MGHDDSAKFFAHAYGGYLRSMMQAIGVDDDPTKLLEQLSKFALQDKLASNVILTCCSAILSSGGGISLASAGHPSPLHISKTGTRPVPVGGILPGLLPATVYQSVSLRLPVGERIALYTDGLFESATDNNARKKLEDRIITILTDTLNLPINESLAQVMGIFDRFAGTPPSDDALLLLMEPAE
jgi:phosphoserine phosphatase RsbU/P